MRPARAFQLGFFAASAALWWAGSSASAAPPEETAENAGPAKPDTPETASNVTLPVVIQHVDATVPTGSVERGEHGDVVLVVTIGTSGHVTNVEVASSASPALDAAATEAMQAWVFRPALRDGKPVASRIRIPFHFSPPEPRVHPTMSESRAEPPRASGTQDVPLEVNVHGRQSPPSRGASDMSIDVKALKVVPRKNASQLLTLAPSIFLTNEGGEGHAEQVFLRGFDAREGQDIEFTVGGVPINEAGNLHGNGYADTHFIVPELVLGLRVLEGPFDPRQGNFAVAGSADYDLGLEKRGMTAKYTQGSFGTQRLLLLWGPEGESAHTFGGAEIYGTDGYGQNRDAKRGSAMGQYEGTVAGGSYRITLQAYSTVYHSAGVIRQDDYARGNIGFFDTYDPRQGGASSRYSVAADLEKKSGSTLFGLQGFAIERRMRLSENFTGYLLDQPNPLQSPHAQRGDLLDLEVGETTVGTKGFARFKGKALGHTQGLELGAYARGDLTSGTQERIEAATGAPYRKETDLDANLADLGLYEDLNLRLLPKLALRGGTRADIFTYDVHDKCAVHSVAHPSRTSPPGDQSCISQEDFGHYREPDQEATTVGTAFLPRASVLVGPYSDLTFSASYGQGVRSVDPIYVSQDIKTPFASIASYEGGVTFERHMGTTQVSARSVFFRTQVDRELVFSEVAGRNTLGGGTSRTGWIGALRLTGAFFDESLSTTFVRPVFDDTHLLVPYIPNFVGRSDTALFAKLPWHPGGRAIRGTVGLGLDLIGRRALPYGEVSDPIFTADAQAGLSWRELELSASLTNVFDQRYRIGEFNYASDFNTQASPTLVPVRHFTAGAPRAFFVTVGITLGGPDET